MKIRFLEDTYIRKTPRVGGDPPIGTMHQGAEIDVEPETVRGDKIQNNDQWYHDQNGWHYWSGKIEIIEEPPPPPADAPGGVMVWPATEEAATGENPSEPTVTLPPANDDDALNDEAIPEGETRRVPSLQELMEMEKRFRAGFVGAPEPARALQPNAGRTAAAPPPGAEAPAAKQPGPVFPAPEPEPPAAQVFPQTPAPQKLNWALQNNLIARDWWQQHRLTGRGVSIAILSTGVVTGHPDLGNIVDRFQIGDAAAPMTDRHGLGTQAAVIAAGTGHSVFGTAPEARLLIGKLGEQDHLISPDSLIDALNWAVSAGADIVAMLVDFPDLTAQQLEELQIVVNQAISQGMWLVAPVGTAENKKPESRYPARLTGVLSVGAHDQFGQRCPFSAKSYDLDVLAPGEGLLCPVPGHQTTTNLKSTSIAAAFTAGFLALIRQHEREQGQESSSAAVFDLLRRTAVSRRAFNKGDDVEYGHGLLHPMEVLKKIDSSV